MTLLVVVETLASLHRAEWLLFSRHLLTVQEKFKIYHIYHCYSKTIWQNQLHWLPRRTLSSIGNIGELIIVEQAGQINNRRWVLLFSLLFLNKIKIVDAETKILELTKFGRCLKMLLLLSLKGTVLHLLPQGRNGYGS